MTVQLPTIAQLRDVAKQCGLSLADADLESFRGLMAGSVGAYNIVDAMPDEVPRVVYPAPRAIGRDRRRTRATRGTARLLLKGPRAAS
jgi:hypothetical protein